MQDSITTTFLGNSVTVRELTVKQVREIFERLKKDQSLFIDDLLDQPVPTLAVSESTGISIEQLEEGKPSDLVELYEAVVKVNPSLASMIRRRIEAADLLEQVILSANSLTVPSAP